MASSGRTTGPGRARAKLKARPGRTWAGARPVPPLGRHSALPSVHQSRACGPPPTPPTQKSPPTGREAFRWGVVLGLAGQGGGHHAGWAGAGGSVGHHPEVVGAQAGEAFGAEAVAAADGEQGPVGFRGGVLVADPQGVVLAALHPRPAHIDAAGVFGGEGLHQLGGLQLAHRFARGLVLEARAGDDVLVAPRDALHITAQVTNEVLHFHHGRHEGLAFQLAVVEVVRVVGHFQFVERRFEGGHFGGDGSEGCIPGHHQYDGAAQAQEAFRGDAGETELYEVDEVFHDFPFFG